MATHPRHARWVAADIEPGRSYGPQRAAIGLCEMWDTGVVGDVLSFDMERSSQLVDLWPFIDGFIGDSPLIFFNAGYDRSALRKWLTRISIPPPANGSYCALVAARRILGRPTGDLQDLAKRLQLFTEDERRERIEVFRSRGGSRGRPYLRHAGDDALACARLVRHLCATTSQTFSELFATQPSRPINVLPDSHQSVGSTPFLNRLGPPIGLKRRDPRTMPFDPGR